MTANTGKYEWALGRKSVRRIWPGLTTREMRLVVKLVATQNPGDWIIWHQSWPAWQELAPLVDKLALDEIQSNPESLRVSAESVD